MVLAFFLPGAGHFFLGRRARALAFFAIVATMIAIGLLVDGKVYGFLPGRLLNNLATVGAMGSGSLYVLARLLGPAGDVLSATYEHGAAFIVTGGVMNLLLILDVHDIAEGRKP